MLFWYRPDAVLIWEDPIVKRKLSWYYGVMTDKLPAKFLIAKSIKSPEDPFKSSLSLEELWKIHADLRKEFTELYESIKSERRKTSTSEVKPNFLDVKVSIAYKLMESCCLCERKCKAKRISGQIGTCLVRDKCIVHSYFHHYGEEAPLVPSGTIFYGGCPLKCVYCQNYEISQTMVDAGSKITSIELARIQDELRKSGARNINHVGGDPIPHIPFILDSMRFLKTNVPQLWNSNMYMTSDALELLIDVIDIWLPDLKYGNNECAKKLSLVEKYWDVVTRNIKVAHDSGDIIIRHLVLPGHVECCTKPVLEWIAKNAPNSLVNIMDQYRPEHLVIRKPEKYAGIARRVTKEEMEEAYKFAQTLGINFEQLSK